MTQQRSAKSAIAEEVQLLLVINAIAGGFVLLRSQLFRKIGFIHREAGFG